MSRIDDLVAGLCPRGVVFARLGDVAELRRGTSITKGATSEGSVPVVAGGRTPAYLHNEFNRTGETIVVAGSGAYAGFVSFWTTPVYVSDAFTVAPNRDVMLPRYCFHILKSREPSLHRMKTGGGVPHLYPRDVAPLRVPVPPLEIQREVVRRLDTFSELEAVLEAELEARRSQYEHYRALLLAPQSGREWIELGDLCRVFSGFAFKSEFFNQRGDGLPLIRIRDINTGFSWTYYSGEFDDRFIVENGDLLIGMDGDFRAVRWTNGRALLNQRVCRLQDFVPQVKSDYVFHYVQIVLDKIHSETQASTVKHLSSRNLERVAIPVPELADQQQIVELLDKLDALVSDASIGLPAELSARRKQYEHYRDRLLAFEEAA